MFLSGLVLLALLEYSLLIISAMRTFLSVSALSVPPEVSFFVIPAKRAKRDFLSSPFLLVLHEVFFFVIPAKRAEGPRELESRA